MNRSWSDTFGPGVPGLLDRMVRGRRVERERAEEENGRSLGCLSVESVVVPRFWGSYPQLHEQYLQID